MNINQLAMQAKNGDEAAFSQIYEQLSQKIFRYIRMKIQYRPDAEDVLQEVFIKSYRGLATLKPGNLNFSAWLYKIASNSINDYFRRQYRRPEIISINEGIDVSQNHSLYEEVVAKSDLETAWGYLKNFPQRYRNVLELRCLQELSVRETAAALGTSGLAVRMIQCRARKRLRQALQEA